METVFQTLEVCLFSKGVVHIKAPHVMGARELVEENWFGLKLSSCDVVMRSKKTSC